MYDIVIMLLSHPSIHPPRCRACKLHTPSFLTCMHACILTGWSFTRAKRITQASYLFFSAHCPTNHTKHTQQNKKKLRYMLCNHENADTYKITMSLIVVDISGFLKNRGVGLDGISTVRYLYLT